MLYMANSIRVTDEYNSKIETLQSKVKEKTGFKPAKKEIVENSIDMYVNSFEKDNNG